MHDNSNARRHLTVATQKIRLALAQNSKGDWCATGWSGAADNEMVNAAKEAVTPTEAESLHWVEVEVEIPAAKTVEGSATPEPQPT